MAEPRPFSRNGNLLKAPPPPPKRKDIVGVKAGPNQFQEAARNLESSGFKVKNGQLTPTQNYGPMVALASEQRNSLSRDSKPGSISTLGNPLGSMYEANPGFFKRGPSGGAAVSPEVGRAQNIANAKEAGTFDIIRDQYNAKGGAQMNEFGTIGAAAPTPAPAATAESVAAQRASIQSTAQAQMGPPLQGSAQMGPPLQGSALMGFPSGAPTVGPAVAAAQRNRDALNNMGRRVGAQSGPPALLAGPASVVASAPTATPTATPTAAPTAPSPMELNRQALQQSVADTRLQREASGELPTVTTAPSGDRTIQGRYGSGSATSIPSGANRPEGLINGRPSSEVMQGLANKQGNLGTSRPTDKFQPQTGGSALYDKSPPTPTKDDINKQRTSLAASKR